MLSLDVGDAIITIESYYGSKIEIEVREDIKSLLEEASASDMLDCWKSQEGKDKLVDRLEEQVDMADNTFKAVERLLSQLPDKPLKEDYAAFVDKVRNTLSKSGFEPY